MSSPLFLSLNARLGGASNKGGSRGGTFLKEGLLPLWGLALVSHHLSPCVPSGPLDRCHL